MEVIKLSNPPEFCAESISEIPVGVAGAYYEFDVDVVSACSCPFQYQSNELFAKELISVDVISRSEQNSSTKTALVVRFSSREAALSFVTRLNRYLRKCCRNRRRIEKTCLQFFNAGTPD